MNLPTRLLLQTGFTMVLIWWMNTNMSQYFAVSGGMVGILVIGALLTLMNIFVSPFLNLVTSPARLFLGLFAAIITNAAFLLLLTRAASILDPNITTLRISGGITGWLVVSLLLGTAKWIMKLAFGHRK